MEGGTFYKAEKLFVGFAYRSFGPFALFTGGNNHLSAELSQ